MAAKKKAAKAGAGAVAAGQAIRTNEYIQRILHDEELRENLSNAIDSGRKAYSRMNGKGAVKAVTDDKKTQKELKEAATSLKEAADQLRGKKKKKKRRFGRLVLLALVGGALVLGLSEGLRKKVLDALFGAEEEFEYTASTTPASASSPSSNEPVGTS